MKSSLLTITILCIFSLYATAQDLSVNGYKHTPQGELHLLIVFAEKAGENFTMDDWLLDEIPDWANEMFENEVENIGDNNNLSKYYYELSKFTTNPFLVTAFVYPDLISVAAKENAAVFDAIEIADPDFPWGDFDRRNNRSFWTTDNSITAPDDTIDYAVIIWRDNSMADGGEANNNGTVQTNDTPPVTYTIADGHKHYYTSGTLMSNLPLFTHEFGHEIWHSPHYCAANNVTGENYYTYYGWGMMGYSNGPFKAANAWEMWWLGWLQGVTTIEANVANNGTYYLKDLYTENEALRIEIPNYGGQYLWIENHQLEDTYLDERWEKDGAIYIPELNQGLYMYITKLGNDQTDIDLITGTNSQANHIKVLHGDGNFDYSYITEMSLEGWGTQALFLRGDTNVIAGENDFTSLRGDYNLTGGADLIYVNENWNGGTDGEIKSIGLEWIGGVVEETYNFLGTPGAEFSLDDELSLSGIVPVLNYPYHNLSGNALEPFYLNGLQIEISDYNTTTGEYAITVVFDDWEVREDKRWCGNIILPADEDLVVQNNVEILFNKSGVPDRSVKDPAHDFINPTKFTIGSGSTLTLNADASIFATEYTEITVASGASIVLKKQCIYDFG